MVDRNQYLKLLENKKQIAQIYQLVRADSRYLELFADNKVEIHSGQARYLLTQPKPGVDFKPDLSVHSGTDFRRDLDIA
jgi:hypothetical protein